MAELPEGWTIETRTQGSGVRNFTLRDADGAELVGATTYPQGGAWVEYSGLDPCDAFCSGSGYSNNEMVREVDGLRGRAAVFVALADDLEERERTTSVDVLVGFSDSANKLYAFECDYPCPVGSEVQVWLRGRWKTAEVVELGTGGYEGKRAAAKLVKVAGADE